ncbi:mitochondrial cardiolipin hydrolase-like [Drosophila bipectinata]|uniref:mitochondrial cardiolipin hydrolase-like n=1 Tax=Drosophila bipectinata TaxID=42026 RepID=UPI001C8A6444|nr:mitochondrial cardiolipin hydrolase-like [Drosophila bipectinata]
MESSLAYDLCKWVEDNQALATIAAGATLVLISEIVSRLWRKLRQRMLPRGAAFELVVFNDQGEDCSAKHYRYLCDKVPKEKQDCGNPFCSELNQQKIVNRIDAAMYSVDLAIFSFHSMVMTKALLQAFSRNVCVRIITNQESSATYAFEKLRNYGVQVRAPRNPLRSKALMHHKFFVVDAKSRVLDIQKSRGLRHYRPFVTTFATGSINWSTQGFGGNWENCLISYDAGNAEIYQKEFNRLWELSSDIGPRRH